jgi:hypothetical protein
MLHYYWGEAYGVQLHLQWSIFENIGLWGTLNTEFWPFFGPFIYHLYPIVYPNKANFVPFIVIPIHNGSNN